MRLIKLSFAKVAVITYLMGACVHISVAFFGQSGDQMPMVAHWAVTFLAGYAGLGFLIQLRTFQFKNLLDKIFYGLVTFHLTTSALVHLYSILLSTNDWLSHFSTTYSYFAIAYFASFGYYCYRVDRRLNKP